MSRARWFGFLPAALLCAVACLQLVLVRTVDLSPWVGGGFGMFASTDGRGYRHLHIIEVRPGVEHEIFVPQALQEHSRRARSLPTDANLRRLAFALASRAAAPPQAIRIEVWKTRFDPETLIPWSEPLRGIEVPISGAP